MAAGCWREPIRWPASAAGMMGALGRRRAALLLMLAMADGGTVVTVPNLGSLVGVADGKGVTHFLGIP